MTTTESSSESAPEPAPESSGALRAPAARSVSVERETGETRVRVTVGVGTGVGTGVGAGVGSGAGAGVGAGVGAGAGTGVGAGVGAGVDDADTLRHGNGEGGEVASSIDTGIPFLDHMLVTLGRYSGLTLTVHARGDLRHHTIEDVAIVVGTAIARALPSTAARYGDRTIPMDDALVHAALDLGGRPYYEGPLPSKLYDHWMRSFADNARATLHLRVIRGRDRHHVVEAAFKALGLAIRDAFVETGAVFSTKGSVREDAH